MTRKKTGTPERKTGIAIENGETSGIVSRRPLDLYLIFHSVGSTWSNPPSNIR
ncbi:hypothetical protein [Rossellomorea sp. BNER]|uniref:hypothetical protein n=1 Tax=Rossellomorea sp. BNER TaxID=2962031 RepID=UPI003AF1E4FE|nr:hypothetical protein [Rossellomorea sp. BNER]